MSRSLFTQLCERFDPAYTTGITRRTAVKAMLAGLAASGSLLIGGRPVWAREVVRRRQSGLRVVVVGGGLAGLTAAYELSVEGIDVKVLEARGKVGGRVITFDDFVPGKVVEGGGEFIGANHPLWMAYAEKFGLTMLDVDGGEEAPSPVVLEGRRLSDDEAEWLYGELSAAYMTLNAPASLITAEEPWTADRARELDRRSMDDWITEQEVSPLARRAIVTELTATNGVTPSRQSFLGFLAMLKGHGLGRYWLETEVYRCKGGNEQLARRFAAAIGVERVLCGQSCRRISLSPQGVKLTTSGGSEIEADEVILAVPPSTWDRIEMEPALPESLRGQGVQMGRNLKYMAGLKERFWLQAKSGPDALMDRLVQSTWEQTAGQEDKPDQVGVCLGCFSGGPEAETISRTAADKIDTLYADTLRDVYPGFERAREKGRFMNWPKMEWTRAGYSFPAPGEVTRAGPLLRRGIDRLTFAGEHCSYGFVGYMEGALQSGLEAAKRVLLRAGK